MAYRSILLILLGFFAGAQAQVRVYDPASGQDVFASEVVPQPQKATSAKVPTRRAAVQHKSASRTDMVPNRAEPSASRGNGRIEIFVNPQDYGSKLATWLQPVQQWGMDYDVYLNVPNKAAWQQAQATMSAATGVGKSYRKDWRNAQAQKRGVSRYPALWYQPPQGEAKVFNPDYEWQMLVDHALKNGATRR